MEQEPQSIGRAHLVKKLQERGGLSRRGAVRVLNVMFKEMSAALARGEEVEFPFGKLERVRHPRVTPRGIFLEGTLRKYKKPLTVAHATDEAGEKLLNPKPKKLVGRRDRLELANSSHWTGSTEPRRKEK